MKTALQKRAFFFKISSFWSAASFSNSRGKHGKISLCRTSSLASGAPPPAPPQALPPALFRGHQPGRPTAARSAQGAWPPTGPPSSLQGAHSDRAAPSSQDPAPNAVSTATYMKTCIQVLQAHLYLFLEKQTQSVRNKWLAKGPGG